jgi:hypothetical protein
MSSPPVVGTILSTLGQMTISSQDHLNHSRGSFSDSDGYLSPDITSRYPGGLHPEGSGNLSDVSTDSFQRSRRPRRPRRSAHRRRSPDFRDGKVVRKVVTSPNIKAAAMQRRLHHARFSCEVNGCGSTFTTKNKLEREFPSDFERLHHWKTLNRR